MSKENGVLDLVLKAEWFEKIKNGEKNIEYREVKRYWANRLYTEKTDGFRRWVIPTNNKVLFSKGYKRKEQMLFEIAKIEVLYSGINTDLHINKPVYAIHLGEQLNIVDWYKEQKGGKNAR